jgi:hypothetical protein
MLYAYSIPRLIHLPYHCAAFSREKHPESLIHPFFKKACFCSSVSLYSAGVEAPLVIIGPLGYSDMMMIIVWVWTIKQRDEDYNLDSKRAFILQ